ncbi:MAG: acyl-ACP--UDP-N-acetylglucosamine O-acyltransferase [Verrucomicrobia bacterium]|nr:acyl-ACP--UDP-N-acetylglucosamine O-acyltransferase [Verrucomicrobiota bacterium]
MSTQIHPTAVIHPSAQIGDDCEIGPYSIIGPNVTLGAGCWLQHHVSLHGPSVIGTRNQFYAFSSIGQKSQDLKYIAEPTYLEIGDSNCFREFVTVHRGTAPNSLTKIGNHGNFLAYSHIAHDCIVGDHVIFSNNGTLAGHVEVGHHAIIGGLTAIHQFCRIGDFALTGGCSKIVQDVPPFMIADGNPAKIRSYNKVGLERHGFTEEAQRQIKESYRIIYRSALNLQQAIEQIRATLPESPELTQILKFITQSPRGILK